MWLDEAETWLHLLQDPGPGDADDVQAIHERLQALLDKVDITPDIQELLDHTRIS